MLPPAIIAFTVAVACNWPVNPEQELNAMAWSNMGGALARQGRIHQSTIFFERAVEGAPGAAEMRYNLGLAYANQGRWLDSVEQLRAALALAPDLIEVDYQLGVVLEQLGRRDQALVHYRRALQRDPHDTAAAAAVRRLSQQPVSVERGAS